MSLITPDFGLLFWMVVIFGLVFFILAKFGFPVITGMVAKRQDRINESIRLAKEAERRYEELSEKQQQMPEEARIEQGRILKEAAKTRDEMVAQARQQASEEASRILEASRVQLEAERESVMRDIRSQVALLSVQVAEKVLRKDLDDGPSQEAFIDRMVDELSRTEPES